MSVGKPLFKFLFVSANLLLVSAAQAAAPELCRKYDEVVRRTSSPVGFKCRTTKGAVFERVSIGQFDLSWKGPDGMIWLWSHAQENDPTYYNSATQSEAVRACAQLGGKLPTISMLERNQQLGFREAVPGIRWQALWTAKNEAVPARADSSFGTRFDVRTGLATRDYASTRNGFRCIQNPVLTVKAHASAPSAAPEILFQNREAAEAEMWEDAASGIQSSTAK